jgi:hypothetical protein
MRSCGSYGVGVLTPRCASVIGGWLCVCVCVCVCVCACACVNSRWDAQVVNLASSDVERFQMSQYYHSLWLAPLEAAVVLVLLIRSLGVAALAGFGLLLLLVPLQMQFSRYFGRIRARTATISDARVRTTNQLLSGIQIMKMYAWEPPFVRMVNEIRRQEMAQLSRFSFLRAMNEAIFFVTPIVIAMASFVTFVAMGQALTPRVVFSCLSLFSLTQMQASARHVAPMPIA